MKRKEKDLDTIISQYVAEQELKGLSPRTIKMEKEHINYYKNFTKETSRKEFNNFVQHLIKLDWSIATKNKTLGHLRVFFYWMMNKGYCEPFKIRLLRGQDPTMKFFTEEEVELLLKKPSNSFGSQRMYTVCCFICRTGARLSTLINLKLEDLDFRERTITFRHLKNKKAAILPMTDSLRLALTNWITDWDLKEYVFCDVYGNQMTVSNFEKAFRRYCTEQGVKPRGPHSLRHAFRRMYIKKGGDALTLQRLLTHSSLEMTKRYVELFTDDLRKPLETFSPLDNIKKQRLTRVY